MRSQRKPKHPGIRVRHTKQCSSRQGRKCSCTPGYEAWVFSKRDNRKIRQTFPSLAAAKGWRRDASVAIRQGTMTSPSAVKLREAADAWIEGVKCGAVKNRSGDPYKPSVARSYEQSLKLHVLPRIGHMRLSDVRRADVQGLVDQLCAGGLDPSTVRNAINPLRVIFRRAMNRGDVAVNPTQDVELPAVRGRRDRIASPVEATALIAAVPAGDRALWATAFYSGLRLGELRALRWEDVDLAAGVIRVERSWDRKAGPVKPKSAKGTRSVPIASALRDFLVEHKMATGRSSGLVFGRSEDQAFDPSTVNHRAYASWKKAKLTKITMHEARHTYASLMIAAGLNAKALSEYMGHSGISITLDRYGHLMPGSEAEAAGLLDAYLERAGTAARIATVTA